MLNVHVINPATITDLENFVGLAKDKEGEVWYFNENGDCFTISEYGIFKEEDNILHNYVPFVKLSGTVLLTNEE